MKYWIRCDRQGKAKLEGHGHRNISSRRDECPFSCIANVEDENGLGAWTLTPIKPAGCPLTSTQALMKYLTEFLKWYVDSKKKELSDELQFLFFTSKCMQELLREYYEVLIMDCTYKTNKYKMPLLIITGVTALNITFYVGFCFMKGETYSDYEWVMKALVRLYNHLDLPYPVTESFVVGAVACVCEGRASCQSHAVHLTRT